MMPVLTAQQLQEIGTALFDAVGSPHDESTWVAETLVRANLVGHDSHGVVRFTQYVNHVRNGEVHPGADMKIEHETPTTAVLNANLGWGQVAAREAMRIAIDKASQHSLGAVVVQNCPHIGRLGEYVEMAAREGMIGLAVVNSHGGGEAVAPWGGIDRRFTPNPIAFAAPSGLDYPILMDITTSSVPEGKVRVARHRGEQLPADCIIDADGNPTTDPAAFYGPPLGALLPLGGVLGHKGYGLIMMTELLGGILSGAGASGEPTESKGNGLFIQAIDIKAFTTMDAFQERVRNLVGFVKTSRRRPGVEEILLPGEPEYRTAQQRSRDGIQVEASIWDEIQAQADALSVRL
ncbi:MAG: Ldh family oxidoreductase [Anaerolineae bacterium]|nr:Ldh family oxidoreductase [Anaerolineae bacterium]